MTIPFQASRVDNPNRKGVMINKAKKTREKINIRCDSQRRGLECNWPWNRLAKSAWNQRKRTALQRYGDQNGEMGKKREEVDANHRRAKQIWQRKPSDEQGCRMCKRLKDWPWSLANVVLDGNRGCGHGEREL